MHNDVTARMVTRRDPGHNASRWYSTIAEIRTRHVQAILGRIAASMHDMCRFRRRAVPTGFQFSDETFGLNVADAATTGRRSTSTGYSKIAGQ